MEMFTFILLAAVFVQVTPQDNDENPPVNISKPIISVPSQVLYSSEKITLHCQVPEGPPDLQYDWYRDSTDLKHKESSIVVTQSGKYECKAKKQSSESDKSETYVLHLQDIPTPTLSNLTRTDVYTTESVSLKCEVQGTEDWTYEWLKGTDKLQETKSQLDIQSTTKGDSADYKCRGILQGRINTLHSTPVKIEVQEIPTPTLSKLTRTDVYTTESVSLKCKIQGTEDWTYEWLKGEVNLQETKSQLDIPSTTKEDSGDYKCRGILQGRINTLHSTPVKIQVQDIPTPKLSNLTRTDVYTTESVSLKCGIQGMDWTYEWFKGRDKLPETKFQLDIQSTTKEDSADYKCRGVFQGIINTPDSTTVKIEVQEIPTTKLSKLTRTDVYTTEKVSLKCEIQGTEDWTYEWLKGKVKIQETKSQLDIPSTKKDDSGDYKCKGILQGRINTLLSTPVKIEVQDIPTPKLSNLTRTDVYTTERVSLKCEIQGTDWTYEWFKDKVKIQETKFQLNIQSANKEDSADYKCKGILQGRIKTSISTPIKIEVQEPPQPKLSIESDWKSFYQTEKVTLKCSIDGGSNEWDYEWFTNEQQRLKDKDISLSANILTISSANQNHSGTYTCKGKHQMRKPVTTRQSENLKLRVDGKTPKPEIKKRLWFEPFYIGEKIHLDCNMSGVGWEYSWHRVKESEQTVLINKNPTFTIASASLSDTGGYLCKAKRGGFSVDSDTLQVQVKQKPEPKISFEWSEVFPGEKMSMECLITNFSENWIFMWFQGSNKIVSSDGTNIKVNTLSLSVQSSHDGNYECQAELKDRRVKTVKSQTESLKVTALPVADLTLETELTDIMTSEMTLKCHISDGREWNFTWYENGMTLNASSERLKVAGTEERIKSEFKCKGVRTERPLFSAASEGFVANNLLFKRKILLSISGCLVSCIIILIIGCIVLKVTRKPVKKEVEENGLFISMKDGNNQTASPLEQYMDDKPTEMEECKEKEELLTDATSVINKIDDVIKDEESPPEKENGMTSFKGL